MQLLNEVQLGGRLNPHLVKQASKVHWTWKLLNLPNVLRGWWRYWIAKALGIPTLYSRLYATIVRADGSVVDYGLVGTRVVTTAYVNLLVDDLQASQAGHSTFKYHASGTGTTAEAASDTALVTEVESRATGTQVEGTSANVYKSVGTITYSASYAITEHGLFNAATAGTLMDRTVFSAINVVNTDQIEFTYELTASAGG